MMGPDGTSLKFYKKATIAPCPPYFFKIFASFIYIYQNMELGCQKLFFYNQLLLTYIIKKWG